MAMSGANLALEGGDPRDKELGATPGIDNAVPGATPVATGHGHHDSSVTFEEYEYWAKIARADERYEDPNHDYKLFGRVLKKSRHPPATVELAEANRNASVVGTDNAPAAAPGRSDSDEKAGEKGVQSAPRAFTVTDEEWVQASRSVRTATWGAVFYLITTDILGPFNVPWAFAAMGYGPGVILYTIFGFFAAYGGFCIWKTFLGLDSDRYPLNSYGDMAFRIYGNWARHVVNFLQSIQLLLNVAIIVVVNGQSLEEIVIANSPTGSPVCYVILIFVWAVAGMLLGQIRTLQNLGWIANISIWLNVFTIFAIMGVVANSGVVDAAATLNAVFDFQPGDPITTTAGERPGLPFTVAVEGLFIAIFAYGGATVFTEFMAEMKRPFDFWKGMICAQLFIYFFYMLFGLFVYSYQGQYTVQPAYQGVASPTWQTVVNSIQLVTSLIAAMLYGNIGIKVLYNHILVDFFRFPHLGSKAGKLSWVVIVPIYWALSFIIGAAIPQIPQLSAFVAALAIFQFSYTFPPMLITGFLTLRDSMLPGDGFNPATGQTVRQDGGFSRYMRGFKKHLWFNSFNVFMFWACIATAILGLYAAVQGMITAYAAGSSPSFTCASPFS